MYEELFKKEVAAGTLRNIDLYFIQKKFYRYPCNTANVSLKYYDVNINFVFIL